MLFLCFLYATYDYAVLVLSRWHFFEDCEKTVKLIVFVLRAYMCINLNLLTKYRKWKSRAVASSALVFFNGIVKIKAILTLNKMICNGSSEYLLNTNQEHLFLYIYIYRLFWLLSSWDFLRFFFLERNCNDFITGEYPQYLVRIY